MKHEELVQLGNNIRRIRSGKSLSQEKLADLADLHRTYLGGVERGERNISLLNILKISRALGVTPNSLLDGIR
jgi:transcriptional regulator with XRE-family HTH domain